MGGYSGMVFFKCAIKFGIYLCSTYKDIEKNSQ